jgi:hypothetical protein
MSLRLGTLPFVHIGAVLFGFLLVGALAVAVGYLAGDILVPPPQQPSPPGPPSANRTNGKCCTTTLRISPREGPAAKRARSRSTP